MFNLTNNFFDEELKLPQAFIPVYDNGGNFTKLFYSDESTEIVPMHINSYIEKLHRDNGLYYKAQKNFTAKKLNIVNQVPFIIAEYHSYFYARTRKPVSTKDGATGCFNCFQVTDLEPCNSGCYIYINNDIKIFSSITEKKINDHIKDAELAYLNYLGRLFPGQVFKKKSRFFNPDI